jgi:hypothetical protein
VMSRCYDAFPMGAFVMLDLILKSHWSHIVHAGQALLETFSFTDVFFLVIAVFSALTIATMLLYYSRLRRASRAYEEAKDVIGDIVISVDKQLLSHEEQIETATQKIEVQMARNEKLSKRLDEQETRFVTSLADLTSKVAGLSDIDTVKVSLESLKGQLGELVKAQEELKQHAEVLPDSQIETAIPIKRERALAPLTDTELRVLEFIADSSSGERTAPEVKEVIRLTREHTARLMKKLYEGGYLERRSEKTPYAYRVKEEMLKILKKSDAAA